MTLERLVDECAMFLFIGGLPMAFAWACLGRYDRRARSWWTLLLTPALIIPWTVLWQFILRRAQYEVFVHGAIAFGATGLLASLLVPATFCGAWTRPAKHPAWYLGPPLLGLVLLLHHHRLERSFYGPLLDWIAWAMSALAVLHATVGPRPRWLLAYMGAGVAMPWLLQWADAWTR